MVTLILYSKPGCHLCEGLQEKLEAITQMELRIIIRDITQNQDWYKAYQYEVPVLKHVIPGNETEHLIPRPSPRLTVKQLETHLAKNLGTM